MLKSAPTSADTLAGLMQKPIPREMESAFCAPIIPRKKEMCHEKRTGDYL